MAGEGPQHPVHQGALGEVAGAADQHLADQLGRAHREEVAQPEGGPGGDPMPGDAAGLIARGQEEPDARAQAEAQQLEEVRLAGPEGRAGRHEFGHAAGLQPPETQDIVRLGG